MGKKRFPRYLLSDIEPSDFRLDSEYVYKTVGLGLKTQGFSISSTYRNPLRQVIARTPISESVWNDTHESIWYLDTLECNHQVAVYPFSGPPAEKYHRCEICGEAQLALKFQPKSVPSPKKKRIA